MIFVLSCFVVNGCDVEACHTGFLFGQLLGRLMVFFFNGCSVYSCCTGCCDPIPLFSARLAVLAAAAALLSPSVARFAYRHVSSGGPHLVVLTQAT